MSQSSEADPAGFLGAGWSFPPDFGPGGVDLVTTSENVNIAQSLALIFSTQPGERAMRVDFGCDLHGFLFEEVDEGLLTKIRTAISDAILYYEPRVKLDDVAVSVNADLPGLVEIAVRYVVRTTNTRYNLVYPFYLLEATALQP